METTSWLIEILLGTLLLAGFNAQPASDLFEVDVRRLGELWEKERVSPADPYSLKHAELKRQLQRLSAAFPGLIRLEAAGSSLEGREIFLVTVGSGRERILLWSQMHGDEPTATCSLLDLLQYLGAHRQDPWIAAILEKYSLLVVPMLNPDGAERMQRRNAQGIDINRDARVLQTPEGRFLKEVRDRHQPFLGFNLHNQNATTTVGDTGRVATIALLAVAANVPGGSTFGLLAKQVTAVLYEALSPFVYGHISRYDEEYNPRAFGDSLTLGGTPVVLIESGGNPTGELADFGVKLNFVGLLAVFNSLASGRIANANAAVFDGLKLNSSNPIYDLMLRNAWIFTGTGIPLFRGDVAVRADMRAGTRGQAIVAEIGDLGVFTAHQTIDCSDAMVTPGLITWDKDRSVLAEAPGDRNYLERGILTVLESVRWPDAAKSPPRVQQWAARPRQVNWGFVVVGGPDTAAEADPLQLAEWLSAGARAWIGKATGRLASVPRWFGIATLTSEEAMQYQAPAGWSGDPVRILPRHAAEAAEKFGLGRRGVIAQGAPADLVIWDIPAGAPVIDLLHCKPRHLLLNGRLLDLSQPDLGNHGRLLGR